MNRPLWWITKDGDRSCCAMYLRHYSAHKYADGRRDNPKYHNRWLFVGPGESIVLRNSEATAFFVWKKFIDDCIDERTGERQQGINCAAFRNETSVTSSEFIRQADAIADCAWPDTRHYTYVDTKKVRSRNPGFCFIMAGWRRCGFTKGGLLILERVFLKTGNSKRG